MARKAPPSSASPLDSGWVRLLDDVFRIPGTNIRFGLDGIIGLVFPAAGDAVTAGAAITLLTRALRERVPTVVLFRMLLNVGLDFLIGLVPGLGDVLDFFYKGSRRNLRLIERFRGQGRKRPGIIDYLVVGTGFVVAVLLVVVPFLLLMWLSTLQADDLTTLLRQAFEGVFP